MKRILLLFTLLVLFLAPSIFAYNSDYVSDVRGDTLVVKDEFEYGAPNALTLLMNSDTVDVPAGRVFLLLNYGYYSLMSTPTSSADQKIVIMGESEENIKLRDDEAFPPVVCGAVWEGGSSTGGLTSGKDLLVKNIEANAGNSAGNIGWAFFGTTNGSKVTAENCIIEHNQWVMINPGAGSTIVFKDSYILNMVGHPCRRNGGVIDFFSNQDSFFVENCTILQSQGSLFKFRNAYKVTRSTFNHNTFVNNTGYAFMNIGNTGHISVTNNIFVNCNVQGYCSALQTADAGEVDKDDLPMGLVNAYDDSAAVANGINFYVDRNLVYWDPTFDDYIATLNTNAVNGHTDWSSQMITMNSRTQSMFDDDAKYPFLSEGIWIKDKLPNFTDTKDLFTTQVANIKEYVLKTVDTTSTASLANWRLVNDITDNYTYSDWPVQVDLSYDDADLMSAGLGGFPLGDLSWFPAQKAQWEAQKADEYEMIDLATETGVVNAIENQPKAVDGFALAQNYPNPFNPSTLISYTLPKAADVTLKVYDVLGKEVATLVNKFQNANTYEVEFNASSLSTGTYIYRIEAGEFTMTKKMLLLK
jgi:hypothetical protein